MNEMKGLVDMYFLGSDSFTPRAIGKVVSIVGYSDSEGKLYLVKFFDEKGYRLVHTQSMLQWSFFNTIDELDRAKEDEKETL